MTVEPEEKSRELPDLGMERGKDRSVVFSTDLNDLPSDRNVMNGRQLSDAEETEKETLSVTGEDKLQLPMNNSLGTFRAMRRNTGTRTSSLELRKLPVNILLKPTISDTASVLSDEFGEPSKEPPPSERRDWLRLICLRPDYSLRTQFMLVFGSINIITIAFVVAICVLIATLAGENVKTINQDTFEGLAQTSQGTTARYLAEILGERVMPFSAALQLGEATMDRFSGYPEETDVMVPFYDIDSGTNKYPIKGQPMPLDWQLDHWIDYDTDRETYMEYFQNRTFYRRKRANPETAAFLFKGVCDPSADSNADTYWENCTELNNDIATGGVIAPSSTTEMIHRKGSDLVPFLRALFESYDTIRDLGVYFVNGGAGASINYPQYPVATSSTYESVGCDWLNERNPLDPSKPIGTPEMADNCEPKGAEVSSRLYNPLERQWCRDQALRPHVFSAAAGPDAWDNGEWLLFIGRAVYDRYTREFTACTYIGLSLSELGDTLNGAKVTENSEVSVVSFDEDGIVVSSSIDRDFRGGTTRIYGLEVGLTNETFTELFNLVDYSSEWDPEDVKEKYEKFTTRDHGYFVSGYPVPAVPKIYIPSYRPVFFVIESIATEDVLKEVDEVNNVVDEKVRNVNKFSVIAGCIGLAVATVTIFFMSYVLTLPMRSMNKVASDIVNNFGDPTKEQRISEDEVRVSKLRCIPRTEISEVVKEFNKMVSSFSGSSMAKSEKGKHQEVDNLFNLREQFSDLYNSRRRDSFRYKIDEPTSPNPIGEEEQPPEGSQRFPEPDGFLHTGSNLVYSESAAMTRASTIFNQPHNKFSSLFLWTVTLIVIPLLIITISISAVAMFSVSQRFAESVDNTKDFFLEVQLTKLSVQAKLRAEYVSLLTQTSVNDLHILSRYSTWLLFGALDRSDSFTLVTTGVEECKSYDDADLCPYVRENTFCDCAWNDKRWGDRTCTDFPNSTRHMQTLYFTSESQGTDEDGNRMMTVYPNFTSSVESTKWWTDGSALPGSEKGAQASGYSTSYDRLRVISSVPVFQLLYNYDEYKETVIGVYMAFEADGMMVGYEGCYTPLHVGAAFWNATKENKAPALRPELCPEGKYGYDPRCREWYDVGRRLAINNGALLHITAPYEYAAGLSDPFFAQSGTSALIDPRNGEHVGQLLFDFRADLIYDELSENTPLPGGGSPILIALQVEGDDNTIVGPEFSRTESARPIAAVVLKEDSACTDVECADRINRFNEIVASMNRGEEGHASFAMRKDGVEKEAYIAYAPVNVRELKATDSSDYSRGVIPSEQTIFSLGLVVTRDGVLEPFDQIEREMDQQTKVAIAVLTLLIFAAVLIVVYVSKVVATSMAEPMSYLLDLIRCINKDGMEHDPPDFQDANACREVGLLCNTMEMLYKVVRSANTAFYAGQLEVAYLVMVDAHRLFRRLENKKAMGIATNNLGNIMLGMFQELQAGKYTRIGGLTKKQIISKGIAYFHEAIQQGEKAYDEFYNLQGWTPICLDFMQHLSNRYFNRGLFLLIVKDHHNKPEELEELGKRDLQIANDMDLEVISYGEEIGWSTADRVEKLFNVKLVRLRGYNKLLEKGYEDEWDADELLEETFDMVKDEAKKPSSELFTKLSVAGRMQEVETELMKYEMSRGELETAAKIAIRILHEDEMVFADAQAQAVESLLRYTEKTEVNEMIRSRLTNALQDNQDILEDVVDEHNQATLDDLESDTAVSRSTVGSKVVRRRPSSQAWLLREASGRFVTMEDF